MTYKLTVNSSKETHYLLPPWFIVTFIFSVIILSILFFPKKLLIYQAINNEQSQPIAIYYLNKLIKLYPQKSEFKIALVKQEIDQKKWSLAEKTLAPLEKIPQLKIEVALLRFRLSYTKAFQEINKIKQQQLFVQLQKKLTNLSTLPLNKKQLLYLATTALSLNDAPIALNAYLQITKNEIITDPVLLSTIANVALSASQYKIAAQYYLSAVKYDSTLDKKRKDTINALQALLSGNFPKEGIVILQSLPKDIWANKAMLIFMTRYAILANRPDLASDYIKRALLLPGI